MRQYGPKRGRTGSLSRCCMSHKFDNTSGAAARASTFLWSTDVSLTSPTTRGRTQANGKLDRWCVGFSLCLKPAPLLPSLPALPAAFLGAPPDNFPIGGSWYLTGWPRSRRSDRAGLRQPGCAKLIHWKLALAQVPLVLFVLRSDHYSTIRLRDIRNSTSASTLSTEGPR
jgi:hypothetical protein